MRQTPATGDFLLRWRGERLTVTLRLARPRKGRAVLRTNIGGAEICRAEIINETERGVAPQARAWTDIPLPETEAGVFRAEIPLDEVGVFSFKACFFPEGSSVPEWPQGADTHVKVVGAVTRRHNAIYTVFPRQFGSFREVARRLDVIMGEMGFRIVQTLPPFPVPTTYAVMGEYGCPFAARDFFSVDPAMAEFDEYTTPLDQFRELIDAVHAREGLFFIDLPANHTGWASTLQTHHPDWFRRAADGRFLSPGAWGVTWADLVELDYTHPELRAYMAEVFLFWCRHGVDGFRCDAGYMIPLPAWVYIVARVRAEFPETVFLLEGLGGRLDTTDALLAQADLDWAYSEIFQTGDRAAFEGYLPSAIARSEKFGTLVHFAETHDNDRLATGGETFARLRVQLAALLSWQGAWGIANGVEWFCREKIDVHGKNDLAWGAPRNMVALIGRLNRILATHPAFAGASHLELVTEGEGNTLAVAREGLIVLANLDVDAPAVIRWRRAGFDAPVGYDLVTGRAVETADGVALSPGEVLCLSPVPFEAPPPAAAAVPADVPGAFHWVFPRDVRRDVCVPAGCPLVLSAPHPFRAALIDPADGRTLHLLRAGAAGGVFRLPPYVGDGTSCRALTLELTVYSPGRPVRARARVLVPPPPDAARVKVSVSGDEVRRGDGWRTVLSNGAGAASQVRLAWGEIRSQYDAFLAANPNPDVPSDRLNLWTRTRCWLQREGYTREIDSRCLTRVTADPAGRFARWQFTVPCGLGRTAAFDLTLSLVPGVNEARLTVTRAAVGRDDADGPVRLVFRPDIEWRSFHATTKAFAGAETLFPEAATPTPTGFVFSPYGDCFAFRVTGGVYHHEPEWTYNVAHPEEAARGQDGAGDLFSPGWVSADLDVGARVTLTGAYAAGTGADDPFAASAASPPAPETEATLPVAAALRRALDLYIVRRDALKTVIAGYPWFLDWGRDTFIFMRGLIAAGMVGESVDILKAFAAFEEKGTLPNIIYGTVAGNRDTTDAPLWFVRCVREIDESRRPADGTTAAALRRLRATCERIVSHYRAGTPNGIHVDPASGLVWSPSHFTWMDTNDPACTPRVGYPVEIQALWISALDYLGLSAEAARARASLERYFRWEHGYRDCLAAPAGEPAAAATPEETIRPNQLFLITLGVTDDRAVLRATEELLVPGGIRSLQAGHALYKGVYAGDEDTCRKPAYHNGTVWAWPFPLYAEAMVETGAWTPETACSFLASAVENLNAGTLCHMSENADGDAPHAQKGCTAQAWSDSELLRVWLKLQARSL